MQFKKSPVVFDEDSHSYHLGEKRLLGITGLIHSVLGLGVYPGVNDYVKDYIIPWAGSRGTAVHHAIQTYDQLGLRQPVQIVNTRYGCDDRDNISYVEESWDVSLELDAYIENLRGFSALANELTVSDNVKYASQIDNVWRNDETGGIWLVDTKTNNVDLYPVCGYFKPDCFSNGEDALKEYLSWQLSIYAELFESENPGMKVEGLACNWLRKKQSAFWVIERKPTDLVKEILSTEYIFTDSGPVFFHHDPTVFGIVTDMPVAKKEVPAILPTEIIGYMNGLLRTVKEAEAKLNEAKAALRAAMIQHDVKSCDFGLFSATLSSESKTATFDSKRFKQDHPDLYKEYSSIKTKQGSLTLKLKGND